MDIFDALALIGGLCLFLFGMNVMGEGLERRAGGGLKILLSKLTKNKFLAFLTGLGVTAVIQSSSATTVMVVGFVNSGIMTLKQSIGVIMGANIGTTVTAWILSLGGISSDNLFIQLLKPTSFTPVLALIGIAFNMFGKKQKSKDTGSILLGFAVLMFGMDAMSTAVSGLRDVPEFQQLFLAFKNPILGVLAGAILTGIIQSSSASVGILQALTVTGGISIGATIPIIMGQNIGTCVTALLSSFGTNRNAKRAAIVHLSFNVIGTVVWATVYSVVSAVFDPAILNQPADYVSVATCHSIFNLLCTCMLLPASGLLEKVAMLVVPEKKENKVTELDERLLQTPAIALQQSYNVICAMAQASVTSIKNSMNVLFNYDESVIDEAKADEKKTDYYEDILGSYMIKLSSQQLNEEQNIQVGEYLKAIGDFERIADHGLNIVEAAQELHEKQIEFTESAKKELEVLCDAVSDILTLTYKAFVENDGDALSKIEPLEEVIDALKEKLRNAHITRLQKSECTVEAGFIWLDLLNDLERTSDHCSNIALGMRDTAAHKINAHEYLRSVKAKDEQFEENVRHFAEKYSV